MKPLEGHPNAARVFLAALLGGPIIHYLNKWLGLDLSTQDSIWIIGGLSSAWLFVAQDGIIGAWDRLLHGKAASIPPPAKRALPEKNV